MPGRQVKSKAPASSADSRVQSACAGLEVDDGTLNVVTAGAGPPVVMLHGWTLDHRMWGPQFALADRYRLIMPDRRGFGRSTAPPDLACEWRDIDRLVADERSPTGTDAKEQPRTGPVEPNDRLIPTR